MFFSQISICESQKWTLGGRGRPGAPGSAAPDYLLSHKLYYTIPYCHTNCTIPYHAIPCLYISYHTLAYQTIQHWTLNFKAWHWTAADGFIPQESGSIHTAAPLGSSDHCRQLMTSLKWPRSLIFICRSPLASSPPHSEAILELFKIKSCQKIKRNASICIKIVLFTKIISFFGYVQNNFFPKWMPWWLLALDSAI